MVCGVPLYDCSKAKELQRPLSAKTSLERWEEDD